MSLQSEALEPASLATPELALALVDLSSGLASREYEWLNLLVEFDRREGWRHDGQLSGVDWLVWRCGLSARTARDKLRVAHELQRRPAVAAAFASGALSYSKVRAITRILDVDDDTDESLLQLAKTGTVADLERVAHHWMSLRDQERNIKGYLRRFDRRHLSASRTYDKMMVLEIVVPLEEGEEVLGHLRACTLQVVEDGSHEPPSTAKGRVDALLTLLRAGRANLHVPNDSSGADRYTVHAVVDVDATTGDISGTQLADGTPVSVDTLRRWACDCGIVRHVMRGASEPLDIGRRTSVWTAAQRRAISVRDHGRCRWPGCWRRVCDIHHVVWYDEGGITAVSNGCLLCPQHHTCVHEGGFSITGEPNGILTFRRPDGSVL